MKTTLTILLVSIYMIVNSQSVSEKHLLNDIDTTIKFKHFEDLVVIKEFRNSKNIKITDTIYSCNYNEFGKIESERFFIYKNKPSGINYYSYDSLNRKETVTFYEQEIDVFNHRGTNLSNIRKRNFLYNDFDSISIIESKEGKFINYYDSRKNRKKVIFQDEFNERPTWTFEYDSLNRIIKEIHTQNICSGNGRGDTTQQCLNSIKYFKYKDKLVETIDTSYIFSSMVIEKVSRELDEKKRIKKIDERWERFDRTKDFIKDGEGFCEYNFFYDEKDRIKLKKEFCDGFSDTTNIKFLYKD